MSGATDAVRADAGGASSGVRIGLDVGKALGALDGIGRYTRGLIGGLIELEAELPSEERFEYLLYPLFRCERACSAEELIGEAEGFSLADHAAPRPGEVDLFHATAWAVPASFHGPLALTLYDLTFLTLPEAHTLENRTHCLIGLSRAIARGGTLCAISESVREDALCRLGVEAERIAVAPAAVGSAFFPRGVDEIERVRRELGVDGPYVLAVGTFEPRKNLAALLEAWSHLPGDVRAEHRLALVGGAGWVGVADAEPLNRLASRLGVEEDLLRLGRVADELLPGLYSGASAFAYPSLGEGFGLPPLEAMACGAPVVASDRPALPEVLGDAALLVDPESPPAIASAIAQVLTDADCAATMREAGRRRVERYSWRSTAESVRRSWMRALDERRREPK